MSFAESVSKQLVTSLGSVDESVLYLSPVSRARLDALSSVFREVGKAEGVPAGLLAAVAWSESSFNPDAVNVSSGATGLMQIMPFNFAAYGITANPKDPRGNVRAGAKDLLAKGYGVKSFLSVIMGYNGFKSVSDPVKLAAFTKYYRAISARWAYLTISGMI